MKFRWVSFSSILEWLNSSSGSVIFLSWLSTNERTLFSCFSRSWYAREFSKIDLMDVFEFWSSQTWRCSSCSFFTFSSMSFSTYLHLTRVFSNLSYISHLFLSLASNDFLAVILIILYSSFYRSTILSSIFNFCNSFASFNWACLEGPNSILLI